MSYKQFCPIAKAMEVVGERWTLLVIRELLMGSPALMSFIVGCLAYPRQFLQNDYPTWEKKAF